MKTLMPRLPLLSCLVLSLWLSACDSGNDQPSDAAAKADAPAAEAGKADAAKSETNSEPDDEGQKSKKDKGDASMKLGGSDWTASQASFKLDGGKLTIKASANQFVDNNAMRQELHLQIDDYKGAGSYTTGLAGSRFVSVAVDTGTAEAASKTGDQAKVDEVVTDAISQAGMVTLTNATVVIDSAGETEIVGSFSWTPPTGSKDPEITGGKFRAIAKPKK